MGAYRLTFEADFVPFLGAYRLTFEAAPKPLLEARSCFLACCQGAM